MLIFLCVHSIIINGTGQENKLQTTAQDSDP